MTISQKSTFHSFQHILLHLSCKFGHFWKEKLPMDLSNLLKKIGGGFAPHIPDRMLLMVSRRYALHFPGTCCRCANIWALERKWIYTTFQHALPRLIVAFLLFANAFRLSNTDCMRTVWIFFFNNYSTGLYKYLFQFYRRQYLHNDGKDW